MAVRVGGFDAAARHAEDGHLRRVEDGREPSAPDTAQVGDGKGAALHFLQAGLAGAGALGELGQFHGQGDDVFGVHVADDGHQQAAVGVHRHPDVVVLFVDDFMGGHVDAGVELREPFEGGRYHFQRNGGNGEPAPRGDGLGGVFLPQLFKFSDVGPVVLGHLRNRGPSARHLIGSEAAHVAHRPPFDLAPAVEIRQRHNGRCCCRRRVGLVGRTRAGVAFDVFGRHPPAGSRAGNRMDVDADFAGQAPHRRGCRRPRTGLPGYWRR